MLEFCLLNFYIQGVIFDDIELLIKEMEEEVKFCEIIFKNKIFGIQLKKSFWLICVVYYVVEFIKYLFFFNVKVFNVKIKYDVYVNMCNFIVFNEEKCVDNI